jgi:hypothetical protein
MQQSRRSFAQGDLERGTPTVASVGPGNEELMRMEGPIRRDYECLERSLDMVVCLCL